MNEDVRVRDSERFIVSNELDHLLLAHGGQPTSAWKAAIIEWHLRAVDIVVANAWVPGMAGRQDAVVEEALGRFHSHHVKITITRLTRENSDLKARLLTALECIRFYAFGGADGGARAKKTIMFSVDRPSETNGRDGVATPSSLRKA
jgi:hypothetical protein